MKQKRISGTQERKFTEEITYTAEDWEKILGLIWSITRLRVILEEIRDFGISQIPVSKLSDILRTDLTIINTRIRSTDLPYRFYLTIGQCKMWHEGTIITRIVRLPS